MSAKYNKNNDITSPDQIIQMAQAFQNSRLLLTAFELGVFTALNNEKLSSEKLALKLDTDVRATDRLLNALCSQGLMQKEDNCFKNTEMTSRFLVKGKQEYMSGLGHLNNLWDTWSSLTGAVIRNKEKKQKAAQQKEATWYNSFIEAMHYRSGASAPAIIAQLDLSGVKKVLDVGGGSGAFSIHFVKQNADISATIFDLPHVVAMAAKYVKNAGVSDRIEFAEGDYTANIELGAGYDLVFLSAIIHSNSPKTNIRLFEKCYNALNSGGCIVVQDFVMSEDRLSPTIGALFALNMLVATQEGDTYTEVEIREWLSKVGFSEIEMLKPIGPTTSVIAKKN